MYFESDLNSLLKGLPSGTDRETNPLDLQKTIGFSPKYPVYTLRNFSPRQTLMIHDLKPKFLLLA